jgi:hypothetical protein
MSHWDKFFQIFPTQDNGLKDYIDEIDRLLDMRVASRSKINITRNLIDCKQLVCIDPIYNFFNTVVVNCSYYSFFVRVFFLPAR